MRLDQVRLSIRPRTMFECLDLTLLICGRHWLGLMAATFVGVVPVLLLNRWMFGGEPLDPTFSILFFAMEAPLVTAPITLYLGQKTFMSRVSVKRAFRAWLGSLWPLILFQGVIRGACLFTLILSPIVVVSFYYLNEIILLERLPVSKTWGRLNAVNSRNSGRIISLRAIDFFVLFGGYWLLVRMLRAVSSLWEDQYAFSYEELTQFDFDLFTQPDWESQVAFWSVVALLSVFRFVTYLDCRIRREGWDVELMLRRQAAIYSQQEFG